MDARSLKKVARRPIRPQVNTGPRALLTDGAATGGGTCETLPSWREHEAEWRPRLPSRGTGDMTQRLLDAAEAAGAAADEALRLAHLLLDRRRPVRHGGDLAAAEIARRNALELSCTLHERVAQMSLAADRLDEELASWWAPQGVDAAEPRQCAPSYRVTVGTPEPLPPSPEGAAHDAGTRRRGLGRLARRRLFSRDR